MAAGGMSGVLSTAMAGAMGAAAYQQYHEMKTTPTGAGIQAFMDKLKEGSFSKDGGSGSTAQNDAMLEKLNDLQRQLSMQRGNSGVILMPSGRGGGTVVLVVGAAGVAGVLYLRLVKGIPFTDMFFTTTHALKAMRASMAEGMERMGDKINAVRDFLQEQLDMVSRKQDHITAKQDALAKAQEEARKEQQLTGEGVERLEGNLEGLSSNVAALQGEMGLINGQLAHTNKGIALMCQAFGEAMGAMGIGNTQVVNNLNTYVTNGTPERCTRTLPSHSAPPKLQDVSDSAASPAPAASNGGGVLGMLGMGNKRPVVKPAAKPAAAGANFAAHLKGNR